MNSFYAICVSRSVKIEYRYLGFISRPQSHRNSVPSSLYRRFITLVSRKCSRMRKPDACSLLTSRHLLCPNCPLVLFLFFLSFSFECPTDIVNFIPRAHSSDANRFRARAHTHVHVASLASFFLLPSSFLPCLFCFILTWILGVPFQPRRLHAKQLGGFLDFIYWQFYCRAKQVEISRATHYFILTFIISVAI